MRRIAIFIGIFIFCAGFAFAEEVQQSFEEKHKDKDFVFLEFSESITINKDWSMRREDYKRVKILKEEARGMGEIPIPYDKEKDKIVEFSAYTITPDGKRHRYTRYNDMSQYVAYPTYSNLMVRVVTMPEVNVGSILELRVVIESTGGQIKDAFWNELYLWSATPMKTFKTSITFPKELNIRYKEFKVTHKPKITEDNDTISYSWELQDPYYDPKAEDYTPPPRIDDYENVVEFSSLQSWGDVANWYYAAMQKNLKITPEIESAAQMAVSGKTTLKDKVRAILEYLQDNFRYVSMSFGEHSLEPHPTDEVFQNKYGDCKDLSLLCVALLKAVGIESNLALFREELSITDPQYDLPIPTLFDHVVVLVKDEKGGSFYIDPLLKGYDIGEYPRYYQNAYTFVINADEGAFKRLPILPEEKIYSKSEVETIISPDGAALTTMALLFDLDDSIAQRENEKRFNDQEKEEYYQNMNAMIADGGTVIENRFEGLDNRYGQVKNYIKVKKPDAYLVSDGLIILNVSGYARNIELTKEKRENPVFYPVNSCAEKIVTYQVPKGYQILSIPENIDLDIGFFRIKRAYKRENNKIIIREVVKHKRFEIPVKDYEKVREFFDKLPRQTQQRIVLKKSQPWQEKFKEAWGKIKGWVGGLKKQL